MDQNETIQEYAFDEVGQRTANMVTLPQDSTIDDSMLPLDFPFPPVYP